ncbi:hypothetical protein [Variovorax sp. KK3]|uniref:hypothetical protein n=1 Tax=Variovorax sp. KK3 TaxID=1855728 RepID=UPI0011808CBA|nr:hypothetical protein [Variovorax sp. KK3]
MSEATEAVPFATAPDLARAYMLYPHRKEVPFILARMSRLLAFDDEITNFNIFVNAFIKNLDVELILTKYGDKSKLDDMVGSLDPVIFVTRAIVEGSPNENGFRRAIGILEHHRATDELAEFHKIIYEHELISIVKPQDSRIKLLALRSKIEELMKKSQDQISPRSHLKFVTHHIFQEVLDHYAQIEIEVATPTDADDAERVRRQVPRLYSRVLTVRQQIARASDVPWLEGPGKFSLYYYFQHHLGRESETSQTIVDFFSRIPGLQEDLNKRLFEAEAFRDYRTLKTWDVGTPLSAEYAGTAMHTKMLEWLKSGW